MNDNLIVFHIWSEKRQTYYINVISYSTQQQVDDVVSKINLDKVSHMTLRDMYGRWRRVK